MTFTLSNSISNRTSHSRHGRHHMLRSSQASFFFPLEEVMSITGLLAAGGPSQAAEEVFKFSQLASLEQAGRSLISTFIHNRLHNNVQTSQCIRLDPLYLPSREEPTFLPTKRTKQLTPFMVLSRGAQPSILAGRRPACPVFQQSMKPATSSFLSIASLAHVRSKSLKDMSHAATLTSRPSTSVCGPSRISCPWL